MIRRRRWRRWAAAVLALATAPWWGIELASWLAPYPAELERRPPTAAPVLDRAGAPLWERTARDGAWRLPAGPVEPRLAAAVEAAEDRRFRSHGGIDWPAVAAAAWRDLVNRRIVRGASTITMQVQRLRDPRPRSPWTKLVEAVRARQLERRHGKDALLAEWLARAPFGANAVGAEAGAWRWFGLPPDRLTWAQVALLAALPQNPARLRPDRHPQAAQARRDRILAALRSAGAIDERSYADACAEPLDARWHPLPQEGDPLLVAPLAAALAGPAAVATTIDRASQRTCAAALAARLASLPQAEAGLVLAVDPRDGAVLACAQRSPAAWHVLSHARRSP
ncbi:MAG: transglycosylase domain-containing protein, partial [Planctomycetes bacterium]|nr:transglycosylase domain-containing protein [Planctomycetota bacterium]